MGEARHCIKCDRALQRIDVLGVEIDRCPACGGLWLDAGEIEQLSDQLHSTEQGAGLEAAIHSLGGDHGGAAAPAATTDAGAAAGKPCPACAGKLAVVSFGESTIVLCGACDGVFLDKGELQRAMELVGSDEATTIVALASSVSTAGTIG